MIDGLCRCGWDIVSNDVDMNMLAEKWFEEGRPFTGLVWWPKEHHRHMRVGGFVAAFERLATEDHPFRAYPIVHLKP